MTKIELLDEIKETLQKDEDITLDMRLEDIEEWDSLANISMISLYDQLFDVIVTSDDLRKCGTVDDLIALVSYKLNS